MRFFKKHEYIIVIVGAIIAVGLAIGLPFVTQPSAQLMPKLTLSQLSLSAGALFIMSVTLYLTIVQVRKSMAKPKLEVIFSENGGTENQITIARVKPLTQHLNLWIINTGNAVTKLFQIDFDLPNIFNPKFSPSTEKGHGILSVPPRKSSMKDNVIISFCSDEKFYCFVNSPTQIHSLLLETHPQNYDKYPSELKIKYRVFGDWAETQEGELKVVCNKQ